jgi:hypothetical protein
VTATVTFDNFGKQETIVLDLIAIKNDWRIYDSDQERLADLRYHLAARRRAENIARLISVDAARRLAEKT